MEKRALVAIVLSFLVMTFYWYFLPQKQAPQQQVEQSLPAIEETVTVKPSAATSKSFQSTSFTKSSANAFQEELIELATPQLNVTFSNLGAAIKQVQINTYHDRDGSPLVLSTPENQFYPLAIARLGEEDLRSVPFNVVSKDSSSVVFKKQTASRLEVVKTIRLRPDYLFEMDLVFRNNGKKDLLYSEGLDVAIGGITPGKGGGRLGQAGLGVDVWLDNEVTRLSQRKFKNERWENGNIKWVAVKNQFCAFILKPNRLAVGMGGVQFQDKDQTGLSAVLKMEDFGLVPGETKSFRFVFYAGPKEYDTLKAVGNDFDKVMDFGKYLGPFSIAILKSLLWIYGWCKNYGVAIILLTIVIKVLTLPLTHKSFKSMKEMQLIQPQLAELREKHKSNPKKLQTEMMGLYKEHKINPLGGCLPLLLQMPILIAFFKTLNNAVELKGAPFVLWIKDLSVPDQLFTLPFSIPLLGNEFNLLPLIMVATFVLQQKISTAANKGAAVTDQQRQQQKMMVVMMPIVFGFMFYNMPSGLVLYFTVSTLLGLLQQYYVLRQPHPMQAKAAV